MQAGAAATHPFPADRDRVSAHGFELKGGLAVCTGASEGIGLAIARKLCLELGMHALVVARRAEQLAAAAARINAEAGREVARACVADVADPSALAAVLEAVRRQAAPLRVLVNCAGTFKWDDDAGLAGAAAVRELLLAVNYESKRALTAALFPDMAPGACVVNVGSQAGRPGFKEEVEGREGPGAADNESGYIESMALVRRWSEGEGRKACAARGVRVLLFEPGLVDTPLARREFARFPIDWAAVSSPDALAAEVAAALRAALASPPP